MRLVLCLSHRRRATRRSLGPALAGVVFLTLVGCGGDEPAEREGASAADTRFAQAVVQHHAQTLQLVQLPQTLQMPSKQVTWTESARRERLVEIEELSGLLREWGQPVPDTGLDHSDEGDHVEFDASIDGVLTSDEVAAVRRARGAAFLVDWLSALLDHERGALGLATAQVENGKDPAAVEFARADVERHADVIETLERLARLAG